MVRLCNDIDILKYEPALFGELHPTNQVLAAGSGGELAGTTFTASGADFEAGQVEPGGVIYLRSADGLLEGAYEIVAVDSATQLCVSVLRADSEADPIAPPVDLTSSPQAGSDISYRISTLRPQTAEVSLRLTEYLWIKPGQVISDFSAEDILDSGAIRQVCAMGVIASAYKMLASSAGGEDLWNKGLHYEQLFAKGMERCRVALDGDGDGVVDSIRFGGCGRLVRD
jgi:hypothetical protein